MMNDGAQPPWRCLPGDHYTHHLAGMTLNLTDDEAGTLAKHVRRALDDDPFPFALRPDPLRAILAKLDPPAPRPEPKPPLPPAGDAPSHSRYQTRRR
jgi:hypothetical protein